MAFPTLNYNNVKTIREDNAIKSQPQDGKVITRKRYTNTRKSFEANLTLIDSTMAGNLETFYDSVETYTSFSWTHPKTSTVHTVRFSEPINISESASTPNLYVVDTIKLIEV